MPNEYIELRGNPNELLSPNTYLVVVEGDTNGNPGVIQNIFDLSQRRIGGNGFLVLLQKTNQYSVISGATALVNKGIKDGFGDGDTSSIGHKGESNQTDLENGSSTFFLIHATNKPSLGLDLDPANNGDLDAAAMAGWTVLDSLGVLDNDGMGDWAYGAINFRRNAAAGALGVIVETSFNVDYVGRSGNTLGSTAADWVAGGNLEGNVPDLLLGDPTDTLPDDFADASLDHIGGPNFGAPPLPGVIVGQPLEGVEVSESGSIGVYTVRLNTVPSGEVEIEVATESQVEISLDGGMSFGSSGRLIFISMEEQSVLVRALDDDVVEPSPSLVLIHHQIQATSDPDQYPVSTLIAPALMRVLDNDSALLSEVKVNPPGSEDAPFEFIELKGAPNSSFQNAFVLAIEGDAGSDPGTTEMVVDLTGTTLGANGLLLIVGTNAPYQPDPATTVLTVPQLSLGGGGLGNGSISFLFLTSLSMIEEGDDLDKGDNGILEGLPDGTTILDAVGWTNGDTNDLVFGGVDLTQPGRTPDGATRFPWDDTPLSAPAWFAGSLLGIEGSSLVYDPSRSSSNAPSGSLMTPGVLNLTTPFISYMPALSGAIADPTNPWQIFTVTDHDTPAEFIEVTVTSDNPAVVPDDHLTVVAGGGGEYTLSLNPIGVGYATITIWADNRRAIGFRAFAYAASAAGTPDSRFHTLRADASTALPIAPDLMLVGDDESQVLRLYRRYESGPSVNEYDMGPFLDLTDYEDGVPREVDIEGSTRVGNRIYWMGSHSHADIGEVRTNRSHIFATDIVEDGVNTSLSFVGYYKNLKEDLVDWDSNNVHGLGADYFGMAFGATDGVLPKNPYGLGFNIEGLAMAPGSSQTAWVGFRAPIVPAGTQFYALIVPVTNYDTLTVSRAQSGMARFGAPIMLDLQGRGIRSIEGDTNGYLIIAGPAGNLPTPAPPSDFKIYTWSGNPSDRPQQHAADLTGLNPEAIVELPPHPWTDQTKFQILSDNGRTDYYNDGTQAKSLPEANFKKFRSDMITLGPVVRPQPFFTSISQNGGMTTLVWRTNPGDTYRLQFKRMLSEPVWTDVPGDVVAESLRTALTLNGAGESQRFYQVILLPAAP